MLTLTEFSRFDARQCVAEWLDGFSPESYASGAIVAERRPRVSRIAGWLPPKIAKRLMERAGQRVEQGAHATATR